MFLGKFNCIFSLPLLQRLNVILTRAKSLLIVVCNPLNLQRDPEWREFIRFCVENNVCFGEKIRLREKKFEKSENENERKSFFKKTRNNVIDRSQDIIEKVAVETTKNHDQKIQPTAKMSEDTACSSKNLEPKPRLKLNRDFPKLPDNNGSTYNKIMTSLQQLSAAHPIKAKSNDSENRNAHKKTSTLAVNKKIYATADNDRNEIIISDSEDDDRFANKLRSEVEFKKDNLKNRLKQEAFKIAPLENTMRSDSEFEKNRTTKSMSHIKVDEVPHDHFDLRSRLDFIRSQKNSQKESSQKSKISEDLIEDQGLTLLEEEIKNPNALQIVETPKHNKCGDWQQTNLLDSPNIEIDSPVLKPTLIEDKKRFVTNKFLEMRKNRQKITVQVNNNHDCSNENNAKSKISRNCELNDLPTPVPVNLSVEKSVGELLSK